MGALTLPLRVAAALACAALFADTAPASAQGRGRLDRALAARAGTAGTSKVIVRMQAGADAAPGVRAAAGVLRGRLAAANAYIAEVPNSALEALASDPAVASLHFDRPVVPMLAAGVAGAAVDGVVAPRGEFDGSGVGVAVIDSGFAPWHDDLARRVTPAGPLGQRVAEFVDLVDGSRTAHDGFGHGTHVAGIIAGSGYDAEGA